MPPQVAACFERARLASDAGDHALALEALAAGAVADIQQHQQAALGGAPGLVHVADIAERVLGAALASERASWRASRNAAGPVIVVVPSIVQGQAISQNAVRLAAALLADGRRVHVLIAEEQTARTPPLAFLRFPDVPSSREGAPVLQRLVEMSRESAGALTLAMLATKGSYLDSAREAIAHARSLDARVCLFFGNVSCPVTLALAWARVADLQIAVSMGVPLIVENIDAAVFNNPRKLARDGPVLAAWAHARGRELRCASVETSGGDASAAGVVASVPRRSLDVPDNAIVLVQASNVLAKRLSAGTFALDLARFMATRGRESVWWIGVGPFDASSREGARVLAAFDAAGPGALARCRFLGPRDDVRAIVRAGDVFLNEYPEGGGNSVIEAMGCAVPVVAMRAGERHAECIGADLVGPDAIPGSDVAAYWTLAARWCEDAPARHAAGGRQRERAVLHLDSGAIMRSYVSILRSLEASGGPPH